MKRDNVCGSGFYPGLILVLLLSACALRDPEIAVVVPSDHVTVVVPALSGPNTEAMLALLADIVPQAERAPMSAFEEVTRRCLEENRVLLIPDAALFPEEFRSVLEGYYEQGGSLILVGRAPFSEQVRRKEGEWVTGREDHDILFEQAREVPGLSTVQLWRHENNDGTVRGTVRVARDHRLPWPGIEVEVEALDLWDRMWTFDLEPERVDAEENTLIFMARGDSRTSSLVMECEDWKGSVWQRVFTVGPQWTRFVFHETDFIRVDGEPVDGARLRLSELRHLSVGLHNDVAPQWPGDHRYGLSDVRIARDPRSREEGAGWPGLGYGLGPTGSYETEGIRIRSWCGTVTNRVRGARIQSPFPRSPGIGGESVPAKRLVPLYELLDEQARHLGWAASLHIEPRASGPLRKAGWIGMDYSRATRSAMASMVAETVQALQDERFLYQAGSGKYIFRPGERFQLTTRFTTGKSDEGILRVAAELLDRHGNILRRTVSSPMRPADARMQEEPLFFTLGVAPARGEEAEDYYFRLVLEDVGYAGRIYDEIIQPIKVLKPESAAISRERPRVVGSRVLWERILVSLLGARYEAPVPAGDTDAQWLDLEHFQPYMIRRDLARMRDTGLNAVSVEYRHKDQASQLRYFIEEADAHGLWVLVRFAGPVINQPDIPGMLRMIQAAGLDEKPNVFSLDIGLKYDRNKAGTAKRLDEAWERWVQEQFGSTEHAERVLGQPLWKHEGRLTAPPVSLGRPGTFHARDHRNGPVERADSDRAARVAYRRFMEDYTSRTYGYMTRSLRNEGVQPLLTACVSVLNDDPATAIDPAAGAVHLDILTLCVEGLTGDRSRFMEAGFLAAYARGVSDRKPVVWKRFGSPLPLEPAQNDLDYQASVHEHMHELVFKSQSLGGLSRAYSPRFDEYRPTDYGLVNPDGTWRPVEMAYRRAASRMRDERGTPPAWGGREIDRSVGRGGLLDLWDVWKGIYREETAAGRMEEVRPLGFNKPVTDLALYAVGKQPYAAPAPMEQVNAEWGRVEIDGQYVDRTPGKPFRVRPRQRIRAELINTGPARWMASRDETDRTVWVQVKHPERRPHFIRIDQDLAFGQAITISWTVADEGVLRVRPYLRGVGSFGEPLEYVAVSAVEAVE